jgi:hypothetical protein
MIERALAALMVALASLVAFLISAIPATAQDVPDRVACDMKWIKSGRPAEYKQFMEDCRKSVRTADADASKTLENSLGTEAGIIAQADRIFGVWTTAWQRQQKEMWIANRLSEALDRQRGNSYSIGISRR